MSGRLHASILLSLIVAVAAADAGLPPEIGGVFPLGVRRGTSANVTLSGKNLGDASSAVAVTPPDLKAAVRVLEVQPNRAVLQIAVRKDAQTGIYPVRIRTPDGISNPFHLSIGPLSEVVATQAASSPAGQAIQVPAVVNGAISPASQSTFVVELKKDQRLIAESESRRLGSGLDTVIEVFDPDGRKIGWNDDAFGLGGDSRVEIRAKVDGPHRVVIHDATFKSGGAYRLKLGDFPYAIGLTPPGGSASVPVEVRYWGNDGAGLQTRTISNELLATARRWVLVPQPDPTSPALPLRFSLAGSLQFSEPTGAGLLDQAPLHEFSAIPSNSTEAIFKLKVRSGGRYQLHVNRLEGQSKMAPTVAVRDASGSQLAYGESDGNSPVTLRFNGPADGAVTVAIADLLGRKGPEMAFAVSAHREMPDFDVVVPDAFLNVPINGVALLRLRAVRRGYDGPIQVQSCQWLSEDPFELSGGLIDAGQNEGFLTVAVRGRAAGEIEPLRLRAVGLAGPRPIEVDVDLETAAANVFAGDYWKGEIDCVVCRERPISVRAKEARTTVLHGLATAVPFDVLRSPETKDAEIVLRVDGVPEFREEVREFKIPKEATTAVLNLPVRQSLPPATRLLVLEGSAKINQLEWPVVVQPVAVVYRRPFEFELLTSEIQIESGKEGRGTLEGLVRRVPPFASEIEIRAEDLPKGLLAAPLVVPPGRSIVQLPISAADAAEGTYKIRLVAATAMGGAKRTRDYQLPPLETTIRIVPGKKTDAENSPAAKEKSAKNQKPAEKAAARKGS